MNWLDLTLLSKIFGSLGRFVFVFYSNAVIFKNLLGPAAAVEIIALLELELPQHAASDPF
jgi:hypothetical protein